jgi:hypothetical protein
MLDLIGHGAVLTHRSSVVHGFLSF